MKHIITLILLITLLLTPILSKQSKCEQACNQLPSCLQQCNKQKSQTLQTVISITISCIIVSVLFCACCFICSHHKFRKFRLLFNQKYQNLRTKYYSQVSSQAISKAEFREHVNFILMLFNYSKTKDNFVTKWKGQKYIEKATVIATYSKQNLYDIQIKGEDDTGKWSASGSIVGTREGVICWFLKQYDFDFANRVNQKMQKLLYVSTPSDLKYINGTITRFDKSKNDDDDQKGEWELTRPQQQEQQQGQSNLQLMVAGSKSHFIQQ